MDGFSRPHGIMAFMRKKTIVAIGDSFTYLCNHLDETGFRLREGYLRRVKRGLPFPCRIINLGINGGTTKDFLNATIPVGDYYLILLGTNDWTQGVPLGSHRDYLFRIRGTILGNLGVLVSHIKSVSPTGKILLCNPVERSDFTSLNDPYNYAKGSYDPIDGVKLETIAEGILKEAQESGVFNVDTHGQAGFSCYNAVKFRRCVINGESIDLPYPNYTQIPYDPECGVYPYPSDAIDMTYDGLHPSDKGSQALANVILEAFTKLLDY